MLYSLGFSYTSRKSPHLAREVLRDTFEGKGLEKDSSRVLYCIVCVFLCNGGEPGPVTLFFYDFVCWYSSPDVLRLSLAFKKINFSLQVSKDILLN